MSRSKHSEAQMIAAVKQIEAGRKAEDVAHLLGANLRTSKRAREFTRTLLDASGFLPLGISPIPTHIRVGTSRMTRVGLRRIRFIQSDHRIRSSLPKTDGPKL